MVLRTLIMILAAFVAAAGSAYAQIKLPDVTGPTIQRIPVFIPDLSSVGSPDAKAQEFVEVLRNDLLNAALFDVTTGSAISGDPSSINFQSIYDAGADYMIAGQY